MEEVEQELETEKEVTEELETEKELELEKEGLSKRSGEEWEDERRHRITGTDVGKVMGQDPYTSRRELVREKVTGKGRAVDAFGNYLMRLGTHCEKLAWTSYERLFPMNADTSSYLTQSVLVDETVTSRAGELTCSKRPHMEMMAGTPDRIVHYT